jgi:DNA-binding transcriptional MerR regulator
MAERAFLSIGEVLTLLQDEFPDVTISKIRFLESQGLIDPERTPSGYRKFYEPDVERLRYILREQKEHYLPLKVIKDKLDGVVSDEEAPAPEPAAEAATTAGEPTPPAVEYAVVAPAAVPAVEAAVGPALVVAPPVVAPPAPAAPSGERLPAWLTAPRPVPPAPAPSTRPLTAAASGVSMTLDELAQASGLPHAELRTLEGYGLLTGRTVGRETLFDEDALEIASLAAGFHRFGVEARHLRMYLTSAEREAAVFEQVALPLLKQRNPRARVQARDTVHELMRLGDALRDAMLRRAVRSFLEPR